MRKLIGIVVALSLVFVFTACAPKATKDECTTACQKFSALSLAASPKPAKEDPTKKIEGDFAQKAADIEKAKTEALAAIDKEHQDKLAATKKPKDKPKVDEEFAAKKDAKAKEFAEQASALDGQKATVLKAAQDAVAKAAAAEKAGIEQSISSCADACVKNGWKKPMTDCQTKAASLDDYGKCK